MAYEIKIETGASIQSVEELQKQIDALKSSLDGLNKSTAEYAKIAKQLADAQKQLSNAQKTAGQSLKEISSATDTAQKNIKNTGDESKKVTDNFKLMRDEIKQLKSDFAGTTAGTEEYNAALLALSNKMRDFNDMNKMIRASAADTGQILGNITGTAQGIAGGFEAASGALELFGVSTESLQVVEKRTMAIIKIVQGLSAAEDGLTKKLPNLIRQYESMNSTIAASVKARTASKAATDAETVADTAQAAASKNAAKAELQQAGGATTLAGAEGAATGATITLSGAVKALGAAIKANPLGLILTAVAGLITLLPTLIKFFKNLFGGTVDPKLKEELDGIDAKLEDIKAKEDIKVKIALLKAGDLDPLQEQILKIKLLEQEIANLQNYYDGLVKNLEDALATAHGAVKRDLENQLQDIKDKWDPILAGMRADLKTLRLELPLAEAKKEINEDKEAQRAAEERARAAASAYKSRVSELNNFIKELVKSSKNERRLEDESYKQSQEDLKESLDKKLISQKQYNALVIQLQRNHAKKLKEIEKKSLADSKALAKELADWAKKEKDLRNPEAAEDERYQKEQADLRDNLNTQLKLYKQFYDAGDLELEAYLKKRQEAIDAYNDAVENSTDRHLKNMEAINTSKANTNIANVNDQYSQRRDQMSANYDQLIAKIDPNAKDARVQAVDLEMEKEQALFDLRKENIEKEIELRKQLLDSQLVGSQEYENTLKEINGLENDLILAETEHETAVIEGEKAKQEAIAETKDAIAQQAKAYIGAVNDIVDKLSDLISIYADEAKERSENEKLSIEARKAAFEESKKYQIAQVWIATLQGIVSAWASSMELGPIAGPIAAGVLSSILTATAVVNTAKIKSQTLNGGSASASSQSAANIGIPTYATADQNIYANRPQFEDVKVVVLESDITDTQNTVKTRVSEATF